MYSLSERGLSVSSLKLISTDIFLAEITRTARTCINTILFFCERECWLTDKHRYVRFECYVLLLLLYIISIFAYLKKLNWLGNARSFMTS